MDKSSFLMYIDWNDMIEELDDQSRGQLLLAIMRYQSGAELPEMDIGAKVAFAQIRNQFRKDEEKYSRTWRTGQLLENLAADRKQMFLLKSKKSKCFLRKAAQSKPKQKKLIMLM